MVGHLSLAFIYADIILRERMFSDHQFLDIVAFSLL